MPYEGDCYAGILINAYPQGGGFREFIQNKLKKPVVQGCKYKISFWFSYATNLSYKTDGLQFIFSKSKLTIPNNAAILNETFFTFDEDSVTIIRFPELMEADTTDWWYFEREFYSNSPANYLTIGSILDSASSNNVFGWVAPFFGIQGKSGGYFDDIRLIQLDTTCVEDITGGFAIYNYLGQQVQSVQNIKRVVNYQFDLSGESSGIYFLVVYSEGKTSSKAYKIIKR